MITLRLARSQILSLLAEKTILIPILLASYPSPVARADVLADNALRFSTAQWCEKHNFISYSDLQLILGETALWMSENNIAHDAMERALNQADKKKKTEGDCKQLKPTGMF
jgi:hypothetical protein